MTISPKLISHQVFSGKVFQLSKSLHYFTCLYVYQDGGRLCIQKKCALIGQFKVLDSDVIDFSRRFVYKKSQRLYRPEVKMLKANATGNDCIIIEERQSGHTVKFFMKYIYRVPGIFKFYNSITHFYACFFSVRCYCRLHPVHRCR